MKHNIRFTGWFPQLPQNLCHYLQLVTVSNKHLCHPIHILVPDKKSKPFPVHIKTVTSQRQTFLVPNTLNMTYKRMCPKVRLISQKQKHKCARQNITPKARAPNISTRARITVLATEIASEISHSDQSDSRCCNVCIARSDIPSFFPQPLGSLSNLSILDSIFLLAI